MFCPVMMNDGRERMPADAVICSAETSICTKSNSVLFKHSIYSCELWQRPCGFHKMETGREMENMCVCELQVVCVCVCVLWTKRDAACRLTFRRTHTEPVNHRPACSSAPVWSQAPGNDFWDGSGREDDFLQGGWWSALRWLSSGEWKGLRDLRAEPGHAQGNTSPKWWLIVFGESCYPDQGR